MSVTLLTIGQGRAGAANKMATPCRTDYCAYDHVGNIIGVLRDAGSAWRQIGSNDTAEPVKRPCPYTAVRAQ
jgi:hypothetical protein